MGPLAFMAALAGTSVILVAGLAGCGGTSDGASGAVPPSAWVEEWSPHVTRLGAAGEAALRQPCRAVLRETGDHPFSFADKRGAFRTLYVVPQLDSSAELHTCVVHTNAAGEMVMVSGMAGGLGVPPRGLGPNDVTPFYVEVGDENVIDVSGFAGVKVRCVAITGGDVRVQAVAFGGRYAAWLPKARYGNVNLDTLDVRATRPSDCTDPDL